MRLLLFLAFISCAIVSSAQSISGKITDNAGRAIPFASVYAKGSTQGTSANNEGEFRLQLRPGSYQLVFSAIGYKQQIKQVELMQDLVVDLVMAPEIFTLKDVVVRAGGEDPAYQIIRNAIRKRKTHLNEVDAYTTEVYIKGLQRLLEAPKKFLGKDIDKATQSLGLDSNRQGIIYLSESQSKLSFLKPDNYREEMISSKVSGSNRAFSFNRATDLKVNFYENQSIWEGLSSRPLISPIADNALFYYRYLLLGTTVENGQLVNKIQLIPRRNSDPVFRGIIYILEDSWRIHSADVYLTKDAGINFVDNLKITQAFYPVERGVWMPASVKFDFVGGLFGFRFGGYYIAMYKNYELNRQVSKKEFAETLRITRDVNKKDSSYWNEARPIPLTAEEELDYQKKQLLVAKRESKAYLDSLDREHNKFRPVSFLIGGGYDYRNRYTKESWNFSSALNSVFYNTVEGWGVNYKVSYSKQLDSLTNRYLRFTGAVRYGFSNEKAHANLGGTIPLKNTNLGFSLGSNVLDLNNLGTISQLGNTINSLLYERNFLKLYQARFVGLSLGKRLLGLQGYLSLSWTDRSWLTNTTDYKWREDDSSDFTSNNPFFPALDVQLFPSNQALKADLRISYNFSNKYVTYPSARYYVPSKYPTIGLNFTKGIKSVLSSDVNYDLLSVDISKSDISLGSYGKSTFYLSAGKFLDNSQLFYTDYQHFAGNQTRAFEPKINGFLLLPYYQYSTKKEFFEGHLEHNFSGFILHKLPLLRKLKLEEIVAYNYLATPALSGYQEIAFGVQHMLGLKLLYAMSYRNGKPIQTGFKLAYGLN